MFDDPFWSVLSRRLAVADRHGQDLHALVTAALDQGPLPEERPAAALWFRLAGQLRLVSAEADADIRLRPDWTDRLLRLLPDQAAHRVLTSPDWPALVAAVGDTVTDTGLPAVELLDQAVAGINLTDPTTGGVPPEAVPVLLIARLRDLRTPPTDLDRRAAARPRRPRRQPTPRPRRPARRSPMPHTVVADPADLDDQPAAEPFVDTEAEPVEAGPVADAEPVGTPAARLVELNTAAAAWWAEQYTDSPAAAYVAGRLGDDLATDDRVTVGYAPAGWSTLTDHLRAGGATDAELVDAGLAKWSRRGTLIDVMRDRVVFGIRNRDGDLVGFTGRAAPGDTDAPKWLNTPTTAIFTKGDLLFGLTENRDRLAAGATPVRVEGVMDALAVTLASEGRAVGLAPLGTALTAAQADHLAHAATEQRRAPRHRRRPGRAESRRPGLLAPHRPRHRRPQTDPHRRRTGVQRPSRRLQRRPGQPRRSPRRGRPRAATRRPPDRRHHQPAPRTPQRRQPVRHRRHRPRTRHHHRRRPTRPAGELTVAAAAMLADAAPDDPEHYLELIKNATDEAAPSWDRHTPADATSSTTIAQQTRARLAIASATLADLRQPAPEHGHPSPPKPATTVKRSPPTQPPDNNSAAAKRPAMASTRTSPSANAEHQGGARSTRGGSTAPVRSSTPIPRLLRPGMPVQLEVFPPLILPGA